MFVSWSATHVNEEPVAFGRHRKCFQGCSMASVVDFSPIIIGHQKGALYSYLVGSLLPLRSDNLGLRLAKNARWNIFGQFSTIT